MTTDLTPGSVLGRYELLIQVAQGSIAQVWAARVRGTRGFQKIVAIKTLATNNDNRALTQALLLDEVRLAALVHHPNVVGTLELGEERGVLYIVMEWVHGETLRTVVRASYQHGGLPRTLAVNIIVQACRALHAAHEAYDPDGNPVPLIHRDVSPQNMLVSYSGVVKMTDFGVAKAHQWHAECSGLDDMKRKLAYMSPEQLMANGLDCRSDVFAVGTVLYLITTGQHPFKGSTTEETIQNVCFNEPAHPSAIAHDYPAALERVVLRALAKDPRDRWSSAADMLDALLQAAPATTERQVEQRLAQFMNNAIGDKGKERMQMVHQAQQWADGQQWADAQQWTEVQKPQRYRSSPPPLPRRNKRECAITLNSISVRDIPTISDTASSSGPASNSEISYRTISQRAVTSNPTPSHRPSSYHSTLRDEPWDSRPYTAPPVDTSRRSDWGALVPPRTEKATSHALAWIGGASILATLFLVAMRETQSSSTRSGAKPEAAAVVVETARLECLPRDIIDLPSQPRPLAAVDLPSAATAPLVASPKAALPLHSTVAPKPKPEPNTVTIPTPHMKAETTSATELKATRPPVPPPTIVRKVDAWDPIYYGGRN